MSTSRFDARLTRLEREGHAASTVHVWQDAGETAEAALARIYPAGVPAGADVVLYAWATGLPLGRALVLPTPLDDPADG